MQIIYSDELVFYNKRFVFNKKWEYANFNLNSDGILTRLKGEKVKDWIDFKHVKLTVGKKTVALKDRPPLHHWIDENLLLCISDKRSLSKKNWWIVFPDFDHLKKWLTNADLIIKAYEAKRTALLAPENREEQSNERTDDEDQQSVVETIPVPSREIREKEIEREPSQRVRSRDPERERERKYTRVVESKPKDEIIHIYDDSTLNYSKKEDELRSTEGSSYLSRSESVSRTFPRRMYREPDGYVNSSSERLSYERTPEQIRRVLPHNGFQPIQPPPPPQSNPPLQPAPQSVSSRYPPPYEINYIKHENPHVTYIKHEKPPVTRVEYRTLDEFEEANRKYKEYEQDRHEYDRKRHSSSRRSSTRHGEKYREEPIDMNQSTASIEPKSSLRDTSVDKSKTDRNGTIRRNKIQFNDQVEVRN